METVKVQDAVIQVYCIDDEDFISLTDMVRNVENGSSLIEKWLRNKKDMKF